MEGQKVIKLIATDMDGTLLDSKGKLPKDFNEVYLRLKEKGILFGVASGRQYFTLADNFSAIKDEILFIAENGAYIMYKGEQLAVHCLEENLAYELIEKARSLKEDAFLILSTSEGAFVESNDPRFIKELEKYYVKYTVVEDLLQVKGELLKVTICDFKGAEERSHQVMADYREKVQVCVAGEIWLDMMAKGINKGTAIKDIEDKLGLDEEEIMVFGDYLNDLEMVKRVKYSYAVANAHPLIKEAAYGEVESNDDYGVIKKIKEIL